jgi:hypothetical protein
LPSSTKARLTLGALCAGLLTGWPTSAVAADGSVHFGPHDVATVFAIGKSDDGNQVQYGVRLDGACRPVGAEPVVGYWREYDRGPGAPLLPFSWLDKTGYGIERQVVDPPWAPGTTVAMTIRTARTREIDVVASKTADGTCAAEARVTIFGRRARLKLIFVQLTGPFVAWVEIRGVALDTGEAVNERVKL